MEKKHWYFDPPIHLHIGIILSTLRITRLHPTQQSHDRMISKISLPRTHHIPISVTLVFLILRKIYLGRNWEYLNFIIVTKKYYLLLIFLFYWLALLVLLSSAFFSIYSRISLAALEFQFSDYQVILPPYLWVIFILLIFD